MKLTCDLCNGNLQMNSGGRDATCVLCGLGYPAARLREKLAFCVIPARREGPAERIQADRSTCVSPPVEQFLMELEPGKGDFSGLIKQGGIGLGDQVFVDGDYSYPYVISSINDDERCCSARAGSRVDLYVNKGVPRKARRKAQIITGTPNPVESAYNFQGEVEDYFTQLLWRAFPAYDLCFDCSLKQYGVNLTPDYLFLLYGVPKAALFVMHSSDGKTRYQAEKAEQILGHHGIGATHFYWNYRNEAPYVISRVRDALKYSGTGRYSSMTNDKGGNTGCNTTI